ncbi:MAG TPA: hypothetical protein VMY69_05760 [Phycisphaerae bacterium]|nr:hypothetical protein [Phycisphaerae bacterium]
MAEEPMNENAPSRTDRPTGQAGSAPPPGGRRTLTIVWRLLAVLVVIAATVAVAHFLHPPGSEEGQGGREPACPVGRPETTRKSAVAFEPSPAAPDEAAAASARQKEADAGLRRVMAGLLMAAADEDGPYEDPKNQDPEERRRFLADRFALPFDYPRSDAPADVPTKGAEVLIVFENPEHKDTRMILLRIRKDLHAALADFHRQYTAAGWNVPEPLQPKEQTDEGWFLRFSRGRRQRIVYAQARRDAKETLAVVYDTRY